MARTLICEIISSERIVYTNEVEFVVATTTMGEIGILPLHAPMVTTLAPGEVRVRFGSDWEWFAVSGGFMQVHEDKVIILADDAVSASQLDAARAEKAIELTRERMASLKEQDRDHPELDTCQSDLAWCEAQVAVAKRRGA
jgi:F-type H+-transporting ATPase subunit epsilon